MELILIAVFVIVGVIYLVKLFKPNGNKDNSQGKFNSLTKIDDFFKIFDNDTINVFIYGHSASGKSSFIQKTFTVSINELKSTTLFDFYEYNMYEDMGSKKKVKIKIADYRGQDPAQFLEKIKDDPKIDCILFMADIAPAYSTSMKKYKEDELIAVIAQDVEKAILARVKEHEAYLSKFLLQIVFKFAMNPNLKSVYFLINKIDVLEELQALSKIDKDVDIEEYAKSFFSPTIDEINRFCTQNNIMDFQTYCISTQKYKNLQLVLSNIVSTSKQKN